MMGYKVLYSNNYIEICWSKTLWWGNIGGLFNKREDKLFSITRNYLRFIKKYSYHIHIGRIKISYYPKKYWGNYF